MTHSARRRPDFDEPMDDRMDVPDDERGARPSRRGPRGRRGEPGPRAGLKRSVLRTLRQLPSYVRLLIGLVGDSRVSRLDRFMVVAAIAYIVSPVDFLPDIIPFFGEVDDIFLLMLAMQRLVENAGRRVLLDHWRGKPGELDDLNIAGVVSAAGFFLPTRLRRRIQRMVGGRGSRARDR